MLGYFGAHRDGANVNATNEYTKSLYTSKRVQL
jgi:hypothetical protein